MPTIEERLRKLFSDHLYPVGGHITRESSIIDDLGADSLDMVELVMAVEEEFNIEIDDADWEKVETFGNAVDLVTRVVG